MSPLRREGKETRDEREDMRIRMSSEESGVIPAPSSRRSSRSTADKYLRFYFRSF